MKHSCSNLEVFSLSYYDLHIVFAGMVLLGGCQVISGCCGRDQVS